MRDSVKTAIGLAGDAATIFAYLSIPPSEAMGMAFALTRFGLPLIAACFGFLAGWGFKGMVMQSKTENVKKDRDDANTKAMKLQNEVDGLRSALADERAYSAALGARIAPEERMTREEVMKLVGGALPEVVDAAVERVRNDPSNLWKGTGDPKWRFEQRPNGNLSLKWTGERTQSTEDKEV